jgi:hypothetical protein
MSPFPHMKMETDPVSETLFSSYLEFRTMDKVLKSSDSEQKKYFQNTLRKTGIWNRYCYFRNVIKNNLHMCEHDSSLVQTTALFVIWCLIRTDVRRLEFRYSWSNGNNQNLARHQLQTKILCYYMEFLRTFSHIINKKNEKCNILSF